MSELKTVRSAQARKAAIQMADDLSDKRIRSILAKPSRALDFKLFRFLCECGAEYESKSSVAKSPCCKLHGKRIN